MVLNDKQIEAACREDPKLIEDADSRQISNCTYTFLIGAIFEPDSGRELDFDASGDGGKIHHKSLGPNETCLVVTRERVNMPPDLLMSYTPLNSLASEGLMMLNASVVEPGYRGPLSCVLVNLSSRPVTLAPGQRISKAVFLPLSQVPDKLNPLEIGRADYSRRIAAAASRYHRSFLDIDSVVEKAREAATSSARRTVTFGGLFVLFLLLFAQMEPFLTKWLREKTGVVSASTLIEMQTRLLESRQRLVEQDEKIRRLEARLDSVGTPARPVAP